QAARSLPSTLLHNPTLGLPARLLLAPLDLPHGRIDRGLCTLGLSVMPRWESVFQRTFEMLGPGGRYAAMDLYIEPGRGLLSRALDLGYRVVARADHSRRFWLPL